MALGQRQAEQQTKKELSKLLDQDLYSGNKAKGLIASSLITLCSLLLTHFNRHPVVLIDEYDVPLQKAVINGYYQEMLSVIRPLLSQILKGNSDPCKVIMTGCLRASKESIFTGMNNIEVNTVLNNGNSIATAFGFTPDEVQKMFRYYGFESQYERQGSGMTVTASTAMICSAHGMYALTAKTWQPLPKRLNRTISILGHTGTAPAAMTSSENSCLFWNQAMQIGWRLS